MHENLDNEFFLKSWYVFQCKTNKVFSRVIVFFCMLGCIYMPSTCSVKMSKTGNLVEQLYLAGRALQNAYKISTQASSLHVKHNQRKKDKRKYFISHNFQNKECMFMNYTWIHAPFNFRGYFTPFLLSRNH